MKKITICDKEYPIDCNALTYINFSKKFGRDIFKDIDIIESFVTKQVLVEEQIKEKYPEVADEELIKTLSRKMLPDIGPYIEAVTRVAYICVFTANENIGDYENWLKEIKRINTNDLWIVEVTEFAVSCFC